jgi:hypothetical protein
MYLPCLVLPYQRVPGLWYTPESVFTQTVPAVFPGGGGLEDAVLLEAELDLLEVVDEAGVLAGVLAGVDDGLAEDVVEAVEPVGLDVAGAALPAEAEEDASAELDFFERLFFFVEPAPASDAVEEVLADCPEVVSVDLLDFFFLVEVSPEGESAACELSAESLLVDFFFFVEVSELACESVDAELSVAFFFFDFLVVVSVCD